MYSISKIAEIVSRLHNPILSTPLSDLEPEFSYTIIIDEYEDYTLVNIQLWYYTC